MANNVLNTRIVLCNDTSVTWASSDKVLLKGEMAIEFPESGAPKFKFGDGTNTFANLPYSAMTPDEVSAAIKAAVDTASHTHSNKAILDAITASFTTELKANYDAAYKHSTSAHAPSNAQANVIEGVSVNGTKLTPNSKVVDVTVPTKVSQLQNDTGFITSYKDTKYTLGAPSGAVNGNATIDITDSDKNKQSLKISGAGATKVTTDSSGNIVITSTDNNTVYSHPTSGVTAGTYKSVTVDNKGHVTAGTNPTYTKSEVGLGNVDNTADSAKSVKYATSAGSASSASKATGLVDYNATRQTIQIGYGGSGISGDAIKFIAGYTTGNGSDVNAKIKDVSKDALKSWLGLGSLAYSSATIPTIPSSLPANGGNSTTVNGHTVNSNVPANAKFTDTWRGVQNNLTSTATDQSLSAYQGKVLKDLVDKKTTFTYSSTQPTSPVSNAVWIG